jgi:hypothetical protein
MPLPSFSVRVFLVSPIKLISANPQFVGIPPMAIILIYHHLYLILFLPFADLFRGVAAMSGAEVSYHSTIGKPALAFNNTIRLGRYLGCVHPVASEVWACILTRSTNDIVQAVSPTTIPSLPVN